MMIRTRYAVACCALLSVPACASPPRSQYEEASQDAAPAHRHADDPPPADDEASLSREARIEVVVRLARARNLDVAETRERVRAAVERARSLSHLPDPQVSYQLWQQPIARPLSFGDANMHMFSLRQTFPAAGSIDARARAALEDAKVVGQTRQAREQDVAAQARRAFSAYYAADREKVILLANVALASELVNLARSNYAAGKGTQQDVLRLLVELSKIHSEIAAADQRLVSARAELNALMARTPDAPLGPPVELDVSTLEPGLAVLEKDLRTRRPELLAAVIATRRAEAQLDEVKSRARYPELTVGVDYMLMPMGPDVHNYGAMIGMSVPWVNPAHGEETRAAEHALAAERRSVDAIERTVVATLRDAAARAESARRILVIIDRDLLPQARASLQSARAGFVAGASDSLGLIDALRSLLDVQLERARAVARLEASIADLERAGGVILSDRADAKDVKR